jgi:exosortase/archaeosortase family protein
MAVIGLAAPGGYYCAFINNYLNYPAWLRAMLLYSSKIVLSIFGYHVLVDGIYTVRMYGGYGVHLVYSCIGFGIMSFWIAFIFANKVIWQKKIKWIVTGLVLIFFINVIRISLLLVAVNKKWPIPSNISHHTLFNIAAYILIFIMIYLFDRSEKKGHINDIK